MVTKDYIHLVGDMYFSTCILSLFFLTITPMTLCPERHLNLMHHFINLSQFYLSRFHSIYTSPSVSFAEVPSWELISS